VGQAPHHEPSPPLLSVRGLSVRFGGVVALDGVTFSVQRGDICGIIGPNGSGKTTLFNCLSRLYRAEAEEISFEGRSILQLPKHKVAPLGIARTFQNLALFSSLTVRQNILIGGHCTYNGTFVTDALRLPSVVLAERDLASRVQDLLKLLRLEDVSEIPVAQLPFGSQKRVELARALASRPKLLLLDEPAAGLNHEEVGELGKFILSLKDLSEMTILLVEHHMNLVMRVSDRVVALNFGRVVVQGPPSLVQSNPEVISAYLGDGF
jgi:branched-chain amino acid transport system ATP-binding protein